MQARQRAAEANNGVTIDLFIPEEGAAFNVDVMAIPADAPHPENAEKFMNFILQPKVIARASSEVGYANAVPAAKEFTAPELVADASVYPPSDAKLFVPPAVTPEYQRERNTLWTKLKSGL